MICPSRGRPDSAAALMELWPQVTESAELLVVADDDDPLAFEYRRLGARILYGPKRLGPVLNAASSEVVRGGADLVGFLGDDHRPRTPGWDRLLTEALAGRPGVAYGDDLLQHERLPTACVIDARLVAGLGYMCPPGLAHMYLDDFWLRLGTDAGCLEYLPGVVIEHMHPVAGKAEWDDGYRRVNSGEQYRQDHAAYQRFLASDWPGDLEHLRRCLDGVEACGR